MTDRRGTWVYAAVPPRCQAPAITGVAGEPLSVVGTAELGAVVGSVPLAEFAVAGTGVERERVERIARAHHRVLTELRSCTAMVPFRLGTVFDGEAGVVSMLEGCAAAIAEGLRLASGRTEWGVKAFLREVPSAPAGRPAPSHGTGTAYLMRRRAERQASELHRRRLSAYGDLVHEALSAYAATSRRYPPHDRNTVLNAAYLVSDEDGCRFAEAAAEVERANPELFVEVTGPWPPYCAAARLDDTELGVVR